MPKVGGETVLARIVRMVQEAQGSKAPVQRIVDKVTGHLCSCRTGICLSDILYLDVLWWCGYAFTCHAVSSFRIGDCLPTCALGLATPTALIGRVSARLPNHHILIKDAVALEQMQVNVVVLDKTIFID